MARTTLLALSLAVMLIASLPSGAAASGETATLHAGFSPDRLGAGTTISFGFHLATSEGLAPPPLKGAAGGPEVSTGGGKSRMGQSPPLYSRHSHGRRVPFRPKGVSVPEHCPHGGFPFSGEFTFQDGSHTSARTTIPCPREKKGR